MATADGQGPVYVVDDDPGVRDAICLLLDTVGLDARPYDSATAFLAELGENTRGALVLDIRMPGMNGLELQTRLADAGVALPIVFITGHGDVPMAVEAMKHGAVDFIRKPFRDQELLDCVHEALSLGERRREAAVSIDEAVQRVGRLTPREHDVYEKVAAGKANKVIAIELGISERTVEVHRRQVMQKTDCRSVADLVRLQVLVDQHAAR